MEVNDPISVNRNRNDRFTSKTQANPAYIGNARIYVGDIYNLSEDSCLAGLPSTDPRYDKARIEQTKGGLLQNAYRQILDNPEIRQWRNDEQSQLLWIKGDPGKGKTMFLCGIIDEL
ncbi:hypothetical protein DL769_011320 [Monosporascus sp. CRB-8-3]|nr:hypothetical protein DL769_011320 [Monosporascus sp. CRB-8-3]